MPIVFEEVRGEIVSDRRAGDTPAHAPNPAQAPDVDAQIRLVLAREQRRTMRLSDE